MPCGIHWFDRDRFYDTAKRVLRPKGVLAVWTYKWPWSGSKQVDQVLAYLKDELLKDYWPIESQLYLSGYSDMEFPFEAISPPPFSLECHWKADAMMGFLSTWSAVQRYTRKQGASPIEAIESDLRTAWNSEPPQSPIQLPLYFRVGRLS